MVLIIMISNFLLGGFNLAFSGDAIPKLKRLDIYLKEKKLTTQDIIKQGDGTINGLIILSGDQSEDLLKSAKKNKPLETHPNGFEAVGFHPRKKKGEAQEFRLTTGFYKKKRMPFDKPDDFHKYFLASTTIAKDKVDKYQRGDLKKLNHLHIGHLRGQLKYGEKLEYSAGVDGINFIITKNFVYFIAGWGFSTPDDFVKDPHDYYVVENEEEVFPVHDRVFDQRFAMGHFSLKRFYGKVKANPLSFEVEDINDRTIRINYSKGIREYRKLEDQYLKTK